MTVEDSHRYAPALCLIGCPSRTRDGRSLRVASWNQSFLLARVSGALAANGINIIGADLLQAGKMMLCSTSSECAARTTPWSTTPPPWPRWRKCIRAVDQEVKLFSFQPSDQEGGGVHETVSCTRRWLSPAELPFATTRTGATHSSKFRPQTESDCSTTSFRRLRDFTVRSATHGLIPNWVQPWTQFISGMKPASRCLIPSECDNSKRLSRRW